jgi:hypothetical protein
MNNKVREYHFISDNHVSMFFYSIWWEKIEHPKKDVLKIIKEHIKKDFNPRFYEYKPKKCLKQEQGVKR